MIGIARLLAALMLMLMLTLPQQAGAAGFGWSYESFDWKALQSYFGTGSRGEKREYLKDMADLAAREEKQPVYGLEPNKARMKAWKGFIEDGMRYSRMDLEEARFADKVISIVLNPDAAPKGLRADRETSPDYVHPSALKSLRPLASLRGQDFLDLFEFGRSWGNPRPRTVCVGEGVEWYCHGAYIIFSPEEAVAFAEELLVILDSPTFVDDKLQKQKYVRPFAEALARCGALKRGIYVHMAD